MAGRVTSPVRVRFAPSPTGRTHLGSGRTALYNYLLARQTGGQFILRIEDTDQKRYVPGAEKELMDGLRWLGLDWDEGPDVGGPYAPYLQSQRREIYQDHARQLIERGHAYYCFCSAERLAAVRQQQQARKEPMQYDGLCRRLAPEEAERCVRAGEVACRAIQDASAREPSLSRTCCAARLRLKTAFWMISSWSSLTVWRSTTSQPW